MTRGQRSSACVYAVLAAAMATTLACTAKDGADAEPLRGGPGEPMIDEGVTASTMIRAKSGALIAYGTPALRNTDDVPLTLSEVRLVGEVPASAAEVVEIRVRDYALGDHLRASPTWPWPRYERESVPLDHYTLEPGQQVKMIAVVRVHETGHWSWPKTEFIYESDGKTYIAEAEFGYEICPPRPDRTNPRSEPQTDDCDG